MKLRRLVFVSLLLGALAGYLTPEISKQIDDAREKCPAGTEAVIARLATPRTPPARENEQVLRIQPSSDGRTFAPDLRLLAVDPQSRWKRPEPVEPVFPREFAGAMRVRSGVADVRARPLSANPGSVARIESEGNLIYRDAFEGCDVQYKCSRYKTEEFIVVKSQQAPRTWSWELELGSRESALAAWLTPAHSIELVDANHIPRLRINAPDGKDAAGKLLRAGEELQYTISGSRLTLAANLDGCKFPVTIDPTWSSTGAMALPRVFHGVTELPNGKILATGGIISPTPSPAVGTPDCELYDPVTGTWAATGKFVTAVQKPRTVLLDNGKVLGVAAFPNVAAIYDPATGTWTGTATPSISITRAIKLPTGNVLITCDNLTTELYNPVTATWTLTGNLNVTHQNGPGLTLLTDGRVLISGGGSPPTINCEIYNPATGIWTNTTPLNAVRNEHTATLLTDGRVFVAGGYSMVSDFHTAAEIFNPSTLTWTTVASMTQKRGQHTAIRSIDGRVIVIGGSAFIIRALESTEIYNPVLNTWTTAASMNLARNFPGTATALSNGRVLIPGGWDINVNPTATSEIFSLFPLPRVTASASPTIVAPGQSVSFIAVGTHESNDVLSYAWDFGDGTTSTLQNPVHTYAAVGTYTAKVTVTDSANFTDSKTVTIKVIAGLPTARFTTDDVVGFVGLPLAFSAVLSTDPENRIASYTWNFGDGSPAGEGQQISRTYTSAGSFTVKLTVTDADGLIAIASRNVIILPADQIGVFQSFIKYSVRWNRDKQNTDTLSLDASVNVGDAIVGDGTVVALEIAGQRFTGTLDSKLRAKDANLIWQVKANTKKQAAGEAIVKARLKKANLGVGFNQTGIVALTDTKEIVPANVPVRLEVAGRIYEILVESEFKFSRNGKRASGGGDGP